MADKLYQSCESVAECFAGQPDYCASGGTNDKELATLPIAINPVSEYGQQK